MSKLKFLSFFQSLFFDRRFVNPTEKKYRQSSIQTSRGAFSENFKISRRAFK